MTVFSVTMTTFEGLVEVTLSSIPIPRTGITITSPFMTGRFRSWLLTILERSPTKGRVSKGARTIFLAGSALAFLIVT